MYTVAELSPRSQIQRVLKPAFGRRRWWDTTASRGSHPHPLHARFCSVSSPAWTGPSCRGSAPVVFPSLRSPRCHFCARVPFTLSVRMCDMKPQLQTFAACDQTVRRGAVLFRGGNTDARWRRGGTAAQRLGGRPTSFHLPDPRSFMALRSLALLYFSGPFIMILKSHSCFLMFVCQRKGEGCETMRNCLFFIHHEWMKTGD